MIYKRIPGLVSVVVPSYNYGRYAEECLNSLGAQHYKNIEIIVVDDCSTDNTVAVVESWATRYPGDFTLVRLPRHVGYAGALTIGFYLTLGEYIAIQDMDDISAPNRIQRQIRFLQDADIDLVGTDVEEFRDGQLENRTPVSWIMFEDDIKESYVLGRPGIFISTVLLKGIVFDMLGGLSRHPMWLEDSWFIRKCIDSGVDIGNVAEVLYYARIHPHQRFRQMQSQ